MKKFLTLVFVAVMAMMANAQKTYELGEIVEMDGVKGMVYQLDENGRHGKMFSIQVPKKVKFCTNKKFADDLGADDYYDGQKNMAAIDKYLKEHNLDWSYFPAYQWAKELGEDWYVPSIKELQTLFEFLLGVNMTLDTEGEDDSAEPEEVGSSTDDENELAEISSVLKESDVKIPKGATKRGKALNNQLKDAGGEKYFNFVYGGGYRITSLISSTYVNVSYEKKGKTKYVNGGLMYFHQNLSGVGVALLGKVKPFMFTAKNFSLAAPQVRAIREF
ncbi:MAG: hypothetical protein MJ009_05465 [Paludibacteraceae bacterium]|nr:hypothetical protein [Paludibacteraceae bacterium]